MNIKVLSLFPEKMKTYFLKGIFEKAFKEKLYNIDFIDLRDFSEDKHNRVDDYPFAYRKGLILKADVVHKAITSIENYTDYEMFYPCPKGEMFTQDFSTALVNKQNLLFLCGYYKGIDERVFDLLPIQKVSIGNFVLSTGELPVLTMIESILRQIPGVVGKQDCVEEDSIISGRLYPPEYTQPRSVKGIDVPEVLLSGDHQKVKKFREREGLKETLFKMPKLLVEYGVNKQEQEILTDILKEI